MSVTRFSPIGTGQVVHSKYITALQDYLEGLKIYSAKALGLVADGTTNDAAALQDIIDADDGPKIIWLPPSGINLGTTGVTVRKPGVIFQGSGFGSGTPSWTGTRLIYTGTGSAIHVADSEATERVYNVVLRDFVIDGNSSGAYGVTLGDLTGDYEQALAPRLENVQITNCASAGLRIRNVYTGSFINCQLTSNLVGLLFPNDATMNAASLQFFGLRADLNDEQGMLVQGNIRDVVFYGSTIELNGHEGVRIVNPVTDWSNLIFDVLHCEDNNYAAGRNAGNYGFYVDMGATYAINRLILRSVLAGDQSANFGMYLESTAWSRLSMHDVGVSPAPGELVGNWYVEGYNCGRLGASWNTDGNQHGFLEVVDDEGPVLGLLNDADKLEIDDNVVGECAQGWVTSSAQSPGLGTIPPNAYIKAVHIHVTEAFNSDGTDEITVGYSADHSAYATAIDVSTTGVKTVTLGTGVGHDATERAAVAYYVNGGTEPTTGKAKVVVEYYRGDVQP